jgi:hypothetical protein
MGRGECNACLESDYEGRAALGKVSAIFQEITREIERTWKLLDGT